MTVLAMSVVAESAGVQPWRRSGGLAQTQRCSACAIRRDGPCAALPFGALAGMSRVDVVPQDTSLFDHGEEADALFFVVDGMLRIHKSLRDGRRQITGFAAPGDVVGLPFGDEYLYGAEAVVRSSVCRVNRRAVDDLRLRDPAFQKRLLAVVSRELEAAQEQMLLLGRKNAIERVCSFLRTMAARYGDGMPNPSIALPMPLGDVACYLGVRPETLSRTLRRLEAMGTITKISNECFRIDDPVALKAVAAGAA